MAEALSAINAARSGTLRVRALSRLGVVVVVDMVEAIMERLVVVHRRLGMAPLVLIKMNADWGRYQLFLRWCRPLVA